MRKNHRERPQKVVLTHRFSSRNPVELSIRRSETHVVRKVVSAIEELLANAEMTSVGRNFSIKVVRI